MSTYFIKTFGCQMNITDSQRIAGFLDLQGFEQNKAMEKANLVIFNTCGVRQTAENSAMSLIHNLKQKKPKIKIVLTGCLANRKDVQKKLKNKVDLFFSINELKKITQWLKENYPETTTKKDKFKKRAIENYLSLLPKYTDLKKNFVPIMTGCNNFCSYCVVPYARGKEFSRQPKDIFSEIENLQKNGCQEITLLGQNVNSYLWKNINFPKLLENLAKNFPAIRFSFLTSHPKDFSGELITVIAQQKNISREIHLPIQSGSDKILRLMNRPYNQKHYLNLIKKIKKSIPDASFTTDVIIGFPGETEEDFLQTIFVFQQIGFKQAYINKYSPRPGTAAFPLGDPISWEEKKIREKKLREILESSH